MRPFASALSHARVWWTVTLTDSYLRAPQALKYLERRNLRGPTEKVSAVLWQSGVQGWVQGGLDDNLPVTAWLLFLACGVLGTWLGRRWFG